MLDQCSVCGGDHTSCTGCDGVPNSGLAFDECGVCGGSALCSSCAVTPLTAEIGKRVVRGPDWTYTTNTGSKGGWLREKKDACESGFWYTVQWEDGPVSWYRVGCFGLFDLSFESCATRLQGNRDVCDPLTDVECVTQSSCRYNATSFQCAPTQAAVCLAHQLKSSCTTACHWDSGMCGENLCHQKPACPASQCTTPGLCDPTTGLCGTALPRPDGTVCDDGIVETFGDQCIGGACEYQLLCRDNLTLLHDLMLASGYPHVANTSCVDTQTMYFLSCNDTMLKDRPLSDACCALCALPNRTAAVQGSAHASRRLLQATAPTPTKEPAFFVAEIEVMLGPEHNTAARQGADTANIFDAIKKSFFSDQFSLCIEFASLCTEIRSMCQDPTLATCPIGMQHFGKCATM